MEGSDCGLRYCPIICLEELRKTTRNLSQDSRSLGQDLNLGPSEYEAGVLTTQSQCLIMFLQLISFVSVETFSIYGIVSVLIRFVNNSIYYSV
jgi:hypothetical protein